MKCLASLRLRSTTRVTSAPARGGLAGRFVLARDSIFGAKQRPVLLAVRVHSPRPQIGLDEERQIRMFMTTFLTVQSDLAAELRRLGGG